MSPPILISRRTRCGDNMRTLLRSKTMGQRAMAPLLTGSDRGGFALRLRNRSAAIGGDKDNSQYDDSSCHNCSDGDSLSAYKPAKNHCDDRIDVSICRCKCGSRDLDYPAVTGVPDQCSEHNQVGQGHNRSKGNCVDVQP